LLANVIVVSQRLLTCFVISNFGKLNYYIGAKAAADGRQSLFPDVDFCINPESVCASQYKHELIWMSGLFAFVSVFFMLFSL
jgi:hypothetical protein